MNTAIYILETAEQYLKGMYTNIGTGSFLHERGLVVRTEKGVSISPRLKSVCESFDREKSMQAFNELFILLEKEVEQFFSGWKYVEVDKSNGWLSLSYTLDSEVTLSIALLYALIDRSDTNLSISAYDDEYGVFVSFNELYRFMMKFSQFIDANRLRNAIPDLDNLLADIWQGFLQ